MTTQEVASRLYELCLKGEYETVKNELYANNVTSTESNMQGQRETASGIEALREKGKKFNEMVEEMHGGYVNEPKAYGNYFFMEMGIDATMKGMGRMNMNEMCKYEVKDGKVISEEFFY